MALTIHYLLSGCYFKPRLMMWGFFRGFPMKLLQKLYHHKNASSKAISLERKVIKTITPP